VLDEVEVFLTGARHTHEGERVLATVLFVDIAGSTERAAALGDRAWRDLLEAFYAKVREALRRSRGREIDTAGDGLLAAFDGPARAIRCAGAIRDAVRALGIEVRCGIHTGECEVAGEKLAGIAVHIGAHPSTPMRRAVRPGHTNGRPHAARAPRARCHGTARRHACPGEMDPTHRSLRVRY
jgi:class 3 adenylate cyclase